MAPRKVPQKVSLSDGAYDALKWRILNLELPIGRLFSIQELCTIIKLGRAPVSHAVLRLQEEQLIDVIPRKGIMVKSWSPDSFNRIIEVRSVLEILAASLAAKHATDDQIKHMADILHRTEQCVGTGDRKELRKCDQDFHFTLASMAQNDILLDQIKYLHQLSSSVWFSHVTGPPHFNQALTDHKNIYNAVKSKNSEKAINAMTNHMSTVGGPK